MTESRFVIQVRVSERSASRHPRFDDYILEWEGEPYNEHDEVAALARLSGGIAERVAHLLKRLRERDL